MTKDKNIITPQQFVDELRRYQKGSVTRRHFLGVTGLGLATAVLGRRHARAQAAQGLCRTFRHRELHHLAQLFRPGKSRQVHQGHRRQDQCAMFGSNEEMLAKLQAGSTGWDVFVPTNYTISTYKELDLIEPIDLQACRTTILDAGAALPADGTIDGVTYAVPKDWGTTGFVLNTKTMPRKIPRVGRNSGT